jgi:16S rRNA pseudouridine516 synthase
MPIRLDQFIANSSELSRKDAKRAIGRKRVSVDGEIVTSPNVKIPDTSRVILDGKPLSLPSELYLMLHKPSGYVSATRDGEHPTVLDLLPAELARRTGLHIAGRLDMDTSGLLLLTTDGQWSHRITSPRHDCSKVYRVGLDRPLDTTAHQTLENGLMLEGEDKPTLPASVHKLEDRLVELTIGEGRYHQVKRMMAAVGNHVTRLHRQRVGAITLDPGLKPGQFRPLTQEEIDSV